MEFVRNFEENYQKIIEVKEIISGKHGINYQKAEEWINLQTTERRKIACRNLVDNLIYITFEEVINYVERIIDEIYLEINISEDLFLYIGNNKKKSNYFMSVIAYHHIVVKNYKLPIVLTEIEDILHGNVIVIDDMTYSGKQMGELLEQIFIKMNNINVYVGVVGATNISLNYLKKITLSKETRLFLKNKYKCNLRDIPFFYDSPYKVYAGFKLESLSDIIGIDRFMDILYYFSPFSSGYPKVAIYFDHKIADDISTFFRPILYGPILPNNLNYPENDRIFLSFSELEGEICSKLGINKKLSKHYISEYISYLSQEEGNGGNFTFFHPFIEGVDRIDMSFFSNSPYYFFVVTESLIYDISENKIEEEYELIEKSEEILNIYNNQITNKISWYKSDILK